MARPSVLMVEDNAVMRNAVKAFLDDQGYAVTAVDSAEKAIAQNLFVSSDIALIDISLPGISGLELTNELKRQGYSAPIIAITARDSVEDKITGLSTGMSDYIVKPFDLRELDARIRAQLRQNGIFQDMATLATQSFKIEPRTHRFSMGAKIIKLTMVEFRIMLRLMQNNHGVVTTQDLIEFVWGDHAVTSSPPLRIHISNLRAKINDSTLTIIQTVPGMGYMLQD